MFVFICFPWGGGIKDMASALHLAPALTTWGFLLGPACGAGFSPAPHIWPAGPDKFDTPVSGEKADKSLNISNARDEMS